MRRLSIALVALVMLLAGCASAPTGSGSTDAGTEPAADPLLARYDLDGLTAEQIIDRLDRLGGKDRPVDLMASIRVDELLLSDAQGEVSLAMPKDRFYVSVAPYVDGTHECFYHSLTTCTGELGGEQVSVTITDDAGKVLVGEDTTTFDNGFAGFWLPRDVAGTIRVQYDGKAGEVDFSTRKDDPTCVTTLRLA